MYQNADEDPRYVEYKTEVNEKDYAHPDYYQSPDATNTTPYTNPSAQPVPALDPSPDDLAYADATVPYYESGQMQEYRGPQSIEGYVTDPGAAQRDAAESDQKDGGKKRKGFLGAIGGGLTTIGALLLKFKFIGAGFSAIASVVVYSLLFGWPFAIGLVALLFLHEMGHAVVMKLKGIPVGGMIFIPMLGAAVMMRQMPQNARDEAEVGIAGPIAGAIASSVCLFLAWQPDSYPLWAALAYFGFFMNLFNLIPIVPFDGGRILAAIDRRVWILGFLGLLAFQIWQWINGNFTPWLLLFVVVAATQLWSRNAGTNTPQGKAYYDVSLGARISLGILYFGLAAVLVLGMTMARSLMYGLGN